MTPLEASVPHFGRLLVANRGEIAIRIARAARAAGIVPLGVYSDADRDAAHVAAMDDAAYLGPSPAAESYLDPERILAAARALRADAVHPGYGFLSERASFARAVGDAGLTFVGPSPDAIAALGDKRAAKRHARAIGVPVVPGYDGDDQADGALRAAAEALGVPLAIKASAGGGGRGIRIVHDLAEFDDALAAARREARAAFGDDAMLLERFVEAPRHVEFQILGDRFGTTIHLGERDCSVQRRRQKLVEEAPSPALDPDSRARMGEAAIAIARSVGYTNAGTVEFLLDRDGAFYFLELNARLQVEHPVTELAFGVDLVALQLAIARGEPIPFAQADVAPRGWAIEARVNAEDPATGLPAIGRIARFEPPAGPHLRLDAGFRGGDEITVHYDSLLAKLIAFGPDRATALARLTVGLESFVVTGVPTNLPLLAAIVRDRSFRDGEATTAFLEVRADALARDAESEPSEVVALAIGALLATPASWRLCDVGRAFRLRGATRTYAVVASRAREPDAWEFAGDLEGVARFERAGDHVALVRDGRRTGATVSIGPADVTAIADGRTYRFATDVAIERDAAAAETGGGGAIVAPMPGTVLDARVRPGDTVAARDLLVVLEAMKMEHRIEATRAGVVRSVNVEPGSVVRGGAILVELE